MHGGGLSDEGADSAEGGRVYAGDCAEVGRALLPELAGRVDLVYLDPPFGTGASRPARVGTGGERRELPAYADGVRPGVLEGWEERLRVLHALLAETGTLVLHCDWRWSHRFRVLLDDVFGAERFLNEVVWAYGTTARGAKGARSFARNHDVLLWYRKGERWTFHGHTIERRWTPEAARRRGFRQDADGRWFKTAPRGDYSEASLARLAAEGRIYTTRTGGVRVKYGLEVRDGCVVEPTPVGDVWTDIPDAMHLSAGEATGYATQKPLALLDRWIRAATDPGALVLDPCVGSGSTLVAAHRAGRRWIGIERGALGLHTTWCRLQREGAPFRWFGDPPGGEAHATVGRRGGGVELRGWRGPTGEGTERVEAWAVGPDVAPFRPTAVALRQAGELPLTLSAPEGPLLVRVAGDSGAVAWVRVSR